MALAARPAEVLAAASDVDLLVPIPPDMPAILLSRIVKAINEHVDRTGYEVKD